MHREKRADAPGDRREVRCAFWRHSIFENYLEYLSVYIHGFFILILF